MPRISLTSKEARGNLPMVCMCCGSQAAMRMKHHFSWLPLWNRKPPAKGKKADSPFHAQSMMVNIPLCRRHQKIFTQQTMMKLAGGAAYSVALMGTFALVQWKFVPFVLLWVVCVVGIFGLAMLTRMAKQSGPFAEQISKDAITLDNVAKKFVQACEERPKDGGDDVSEDEEVAEYADEEQEERPSRRARPNSRKPDPKSKRRDRGR